MNDVREHNAESDLEIAVANTSPNEAVSQGQDEEDLDLEVLKAQVIRHLHRVYDPEIPVNVYELGLIYGVEVDKDGAVSISMTLTSPHCPVAGSLIADVERVVGMIDEVTLVRVELTWDPPWGPERMSEAARLELNFW